LLVRGCAAAGLWLESESAPPVMVGAGCVEPGTEVEAVFLVSSLPVLSVVVGGSVI